MLKVYNFDRHGKAIVCDERLEYDEETRVQVARIWEEMLANSTKTLFDGELLCVKSIEDNQLVCQRTSYRYYAVSRKADAKLEIPMVKGLGVSALMTSSDDRIIFGKRSSKMFQFGGAVELAGCGGVPYNRVNDSGEIDYAGQLLAEIEEETGVVAGELGSVEPLCLVEDVSENSVDIALKLRCNLSGQEILDRQRSLANQEYDELFAVKPDDLEAFLNSGAGEIVKVSLILLDRAGYNISTVNQ